MSGAHLCSYALEYRLLSHCEAAAKANARCQTSDRPEGAACGPRGPCNFGRLWCLVFGFLDPTPKIPAWMLAILAEGWVSSLSGAG